MIAHGPWPILPVPEEGSWRQPAPAWRGAERVLPLRVYPSMWRRFKSQFREFRRRPPGKRFQGHYESRKKAGDKPAAWTRVLNLVLAAVCFVLGIVFSLIPGIPGFVFFFVSAALLAAESLRTARFLDAAELKIRAGWKRVRHPGKSNAPSVRKRPARLARLAK